MAGMFVERDATGAGQSLGSEPTRAEVCRTGEKGTGTSARHMGQRTVLIEDVFARLYLTFSEESVVFRNVTARAELSL